MESKFGHPSVGMQKLVFINVTLYPEAWTEKFVRLGNSTAM